MKLVKLLANLGYGSRKQVTSMFREGRITDAAGEVLYTDDLKADKKPALQSRADLEAKFAADVADGVAAAAAGMVDDVIDPAETRKYVIAALEMLSSKRESNPPKKHGNLPL